VAGAASDKKALDTVLIKMNKVSSVCDYFVITSGASTTQVRAIADHIIKVLRDKGEKLRRSEGEREALWIVLDSGDVVVHVFLEETRRFYDLERLWRDAPKERFRELTASKARKIPAKRRAPAAKKKVSRKKKKARKK